LTPKSNAFISLRKGKNAVNFGENPKAVLTMFGDKGKKTQGVEWLAYCMKMRSAF